MTMDWSGPWASAEPSVVTELMNINSDSGCHNKAIDPDMTLGSSPGSDNTMAPYEITSHSDQRSPHCGMALGDPPGYRLQPRPWTSM